MESKIRRSRGVDRVMTVIFYLVAIFFVRSSDRLCGQGHHRRSHGGKAGDVPASREKEASETSCSTRSISYLSPLLVSIPLGVCAGIYLAMYAKQGK